MKKMLTNVRTAFTLSGYMVVKERANSSLPVRDAVLS